MTSPYLGMGTFGVGNPAGGGTVYPLTASTTNSLLQDADVPIYWLLDFFYGVLQIHTQGRWAAEVANLGYTFNNMYPNIVGSYIPFNPFPFLQDSSIKFPLLAMYRVDGKISERTIAFHRIESEIEIAYVLPPLTMAQTEKIGPFLNVVMDVLTDRNEYGFDPQYRSGYNVGLAAGYDAVGMKSFANMMIPHITTNLPMQAVVMKMMIRERNDVIPDAFRTITGFDTDIKLQATPTGINNFIDMNSDALPIPGPNGN